MSLILRQYCIVERNVGQTRIALRGIVDELLKPLNDQIHDLLLLFIDKQVPHHSLVFVLHLYGTVRLDGQLKTYFEKDVS